MIKIKNALHLFKNIGVIQTADNSMITRIDVFLNNTELPTTALQRRKIIKCCLNATLHNFRQRKSL